MSNHSCQIRASNCTVNRARPLTSDEQKAAEAAFRRQPFNPGWTQAALIVYAGITAAMGHANVPAHVPAAEYASRPTSGRTIY